MASNTDEKAKAFLARLIRLEQERRDNSEDRKELGSEMKSANLLKEEIAGVKLAVKRHFEAFEARIFRESAEGYAAALGDFKDTPLGDAAIRQIADKPARSKKRGVVTAAQEFVDAVKAGGHDVTIEAGGKSVTIEADKPKNTKPGWQGDRDVTLPEPPSPIH